MSDTSATSEAEDPYQLILKSLVHKDWPVAELCAFVLHLQEQHTALDMDKVLFIASIFSNKNQCMPIVQYLVRECGAKVVPISSRRANAVLHAVICNRRNRTDIVEFLFREGNALPYIDAFGPHGYTPLHLAVRQGFAPMVELLIRYGANVNQVHKTSRKTPLFMACAQNNLHLCRILLEQGHADPNATGRFVPLVHASDKGHYEIVQYLLQQPNMDVSKAQFASRMSALHVVCKKGQLRMVRLLIEEGGANVEQVDRHGNTALLSACLPDSKSNLDVVRYLVETAKANLHARNKEGWTVFLLSCFHPSDNHQVFRYLFLDVAPRVNLLADDDEENLGVNPLTGKNALHVMNRRCLHYKMRLLLAHRAGQRYAHMTDKEGRTPLHYAVQRGETPCRILLQGRMSLLNHRDHQGRTPLYAACQRHRCAAVEYLVVQCGAQVNGTQNSRATGDTILHVAVRRAIEELGRKFGTYFYDYLKPPAHRSYFPKLRKVHILVDQGHANIVDVNHLNETCLNLVENSAPRESYGKRQLYNYLHSTQNNRVHSLVHYLNSTFDWFNSSI